MNLHVIPATDYRQDGMHVRRDPKVWHGRNKPSPARRFGIVRFANKVTRRRVAGEAPRLTEARIELVSHGQRVRIARGVDEAMLDSLLLEMRSDSEARIEVILRGGERIRIARGIDARELCSLLARSI